LSNLLKDRSKMGFKYESPIFDFKYLTSNKKFNFKFLEQRELEKFLRKLFKLIHKIQTEFTLKSLFTINNKNFFESFKISYLYFDLPKILICTEDTKVYVFRITSFRIFGQVFSISILHHQLEVRLSF
jgi:hypothetical protein